MDLPLFPLHAVLCPGIALPLHVFEPRYRLLVDRCLALEVPFGIVLIREGREVGGDSVSIAAVGTLAEIRQAHRYPDGRYDLLVVGTGRFSIDAVDPEREPYLVARVTPLDDELGDPLVAAKLASRTMRRFVDYLHLLQPLDGETAEEIDVRIEVETEPDPAAESETPPARAADAEPPDTRRETELEERARRLIIPEDPTVLSHLLSGIIQVDSLERQVLLEADTTAERLAGLGTLIDREIWMLRRRLRHYSVDRAHDAVRRN